MTISNLEASRLTAGAERPKQRARTRARIERAARKLFANGGYFTTSIGKIAETAGLSRSVFYLHFRDKHDLLESLIRQNITVRFRSMTSVAWPADPTDDDLRKWVDHTIDDIARSMDGVRLFNLGSFVDPAFGAMVYLEQNERMHRFVRRNPVFRIVDDDDDIRIDRFTELCMIVYEIGQVSLALAYKAWPSDRDLAATIVVRQLREFIDRGAPLHSP